MNAVTLSVKRLYKNAGKAVAWWQVSAIAEAGNEHNAHLEIRYAKSEGGAEIVKKTPVKGVNIGRSNQTTAAEQAMAEAKSRWTKQLDKGYVEDIADASKPVTNTLGFCKPQLSKPADEIDFDKVDWATAYLQPKLDGHRSLKAPAGPIYSRQGNLQNVAHIQAALEAMPALNALHTDGELYIHTDEYTLQGLGSLIKKVQPASQRLEYWIYDTVSDQPFEQRYEALQRGFAQSAGHDIRLVLVPTHKVNSLEEAMTLHREFVSHLFEGSILRWGKEVYQDGKRSKYSIKLKDFTDAEYPVVGYKLGTPSVINGETLQVPIFEYEVRPGLTAFVTAMGTAAEKHAEYLALVDGKNTDRRMLTIKHFGFTDDGVPNIATAKCWHEPI